MQRNILISTNYYYFSHCKTNSNPCFKQSTSSFHFQNQMFQLRKLTFRFQKQKKKKIYHTNRIQTTSIAKQLNFNSEIGNISNSKFHHTNKIQTDPIASERFPVPNPNYSNRKKTTELHFILLRIPIPNTLPKSKPFQSQKQPNNRKRVREREREPCQTLILRASLLSPLT